MKLFFKNELEKYLEDYKVPAFNNNYISKRKNLLEVYFFNKELTINELKWIV